MRLALVALALALAGIASGAPAPKRIAPLVGLMAPDSTFRILSVGRRESHYPYIRSWVEPDTIRWVDAMVWADTAKVDSSASFSVDGYRRCRVLMYRRGGRWCVDMECAR